MSGSEETVPQGSGSPLREVKTNGARYRMFKKVLFTLSAAKRAMPFRGNLLKIDLLRISILLCGAATAPGHAQTEPYYQGKTIRIIVGFSAGGLSDQWARTFARSMPKFIPGRPNIIVQNMPGAIYIVASILVSSGAPRR